MRIRFAQFGDIWFRQSARKGLTLVEILISIGVIVVLVALLLPAIQRVRESASQVRCMVNLQQLGRALHNHHNEVGAFPTAGWEWSANRTWSDNGYPATLDQQAWGWTYQILPYTDYPTLWENPTDADVARSVILHYICPSRRRPYSTVIHGFSNVAGNLIQNPSFEAGNYPGGRQRLTAGSPDITNWTVNSGVDYVGNGWNASDGGRSVDLNTLSPGSISQTVTTLPGVDYTVTFDLAGHPSGQKIKQMEVQAGPVTQSYTFDATGSNSSNMRWVSKTFTFTANAASTTVTFRSIAPTGQHGPAIDNVRLVRTSVNNPFSGRALNDYAASVDSMGTSTFPTDDISSRVHNGVIVGGLANSAVRISDIRDGTSSTMMLGEKSIELNFVTMDGGDSHGWAVGCDVNIVRTGEFPPARGYAVPCGPGNTDTWGCAKARFGAEHWVSFNVLYSDSSVRSVKYDVDHNVFKLMIERNDGVAFTDPTIER